MKQLFTILFLCACFSAFSQTGNFDYLTANRRFTLAGRTVKGISNDTTWLIGSADSLVTQYAVKGYISNVFGPGATFGYNFDPNDFIVSGYDISIRFPQDPGEPLFTNSPAFNLTQQHIDFLDSLMLALRDSNYTYFADRDFYGTGKGTSPFFTKSLTLTTTGSGAASWDSTTKVLNIPIASGGGTGGGGSSPYYLPYNGDSSSYIGGDTVLHHLPPQPPPGDSIDYGFTALTTIYNEHGPGEYTVTPNGITANPDNTNFPFRQLKSLDIGAWTSGSYISFTKNTTFSTTAFTFLRAFIRLKSVVDIPSSLSFRFYLNGSPISSLISCVNYGLIKNKVGTYMNISIPLSAFGFTSNNFDELRFEFGGSNADGIYMDLVQLQNAAIDENKYVTDVHRIPGTVTVQQVLGGQNVFAFNDSIGGNSGTVTWLGTTYNINNGNNITLATPTTSNVTEGSNLYYTDTRARAAITLTTTGTNGAATYINGVLNVPNYALSSQWTTATNGIYYNSGNVAIGATTITTSDKLQVTGTANIIGYNTSNSTLKVGSFEFQPYSLNNAWLGENVYFNGSNFIRRSTGGAGLFYFAGDEGQFRFVTTGAANSTISSQAQLKINADGTFAVGPSVSNTQGNYTGASLIVKSNGHVGINNPAAGSMLTVGGSAAFALNRVTSNYTATDLDHTIVCTGSVSVVTLPNMTNTDGRIYIIKNMGSSTITINSTGGNLFDDIATSPTVSPGQVLWLQAGGGSSNSWYKIY